MAKTKDLLGGELPVDKLPQNERSDQRSDRLPEHLLRQLDVAAVARIAGRQPRAQAPEAPESGPLGLLVSVHQPPTPAVEDLGLAAANGHHAALVVEADVAFEEGRSGTLRGPESQARSDGPIT